MPKFVVTLQGENYKIGIEERRWLFSSIIVWKPVGFYTTRLVEADSANEAIEIALANVRIKLNKLTPLTEDSTLTLVKIEENEDLFDHDESNKGFSFYEM